MRVDLHPKKYDRLQTICRESVDCTGIEAIELVTVNVNENTGDFDYLYVFRDIEYRYGILDPFDVCGLPAIKHELVWFSTKDASTIEEAVECYQAFVDEMRREPK